MRIRTILVSLATIVFAGLTTSVARADDPDRPSTPKVHPKGELFGAAGAVAGTSTWPDDPVALSTLKVGWRFMDVIAPYFLTRLGYADVNQRSLLTLSIGAQAWGRIAMLRPYVRASVMHQHEESLSALKADPGGALFGVGDGIRHRYGGEGAIGTDVPLVSRNKFTLYATVEAVGDWLPDPRGPEWYLLASTAIGMHYAFF
jgi:hypothetical protein